MILKLSVEPLVSMPCGCPIYGTKVLVDGKLMPHAVCVSVELEHSSGPRRCVWRVDSLAHDADGTLRTVDGPSGREPVNETITIIDDAPERRVELRCKHHPDYGEET